jgi:hypothetical protein
VLPIDASLKQPKACLVVSAGICDTVFSNLHRLALFAGFAGWPEHGMNKSRAIG